MANLFVVRGFHTSPFAGGDDFVSIAERSDIPAIKERYARYYTLKGSHIKGTLGLIMNGFKVDDSHFDFLSYDCAYTKAGVEVVKQVLRVVRYGSSTPDKGPTDKLVEQVK